MPTFLWAGPQTAVFQQVKGKVKVLRADKVWDAKLGSTVQQGDEIRCL